MNKKSSNKYEIEIKALLSKEKYESLLEELPKRMRKINEENVQVKKYAPNMFLRHSKKKVEFVYKQGDATDISRKEIIIPLKSKKNLDDLEEILKCLGFTSDPPWETQKDEFSYILDGFEYTLSLQYTPNFAYILEAEFLSATDDKDIHEEKLKQIIRSLGAEPINPAEFSERIKKYIQEKK